MAKKHGTIIVFASVIVLALVLLVTQSIYMNLYVKRNLGIRDTLETVMSIVMVVISIVTIGIAAYLIFYKNMEEVGAFLLILSFILLAISFSLGIIVERSAYLAFTNMSDKILVQTPTYVKDAMNVFIPNVIFFSLASIGFVTGKVIELKAY